MGSDKCYKGFERLVPGRINNETKSKYLYNGEWKEVIKRIEEIKIRGSETFYDTVSYTHHGPVSYDNSFGSENEKVGFAMK